MIECDFCDEEFDSERELHLHWGEEHEDELNSHQKDKVKKARREAESDKEKQRKERKKKLFYGVTGILILGLVGLVGPQLIPSGTTTDANLDLEGQPMMGNESAPVTVVEFGDYSCGYCRQFELETHPQLKENYIDTGQVKFYYVNLAILGDASTKTAAATESVYEQDPDQFWSYHKAVFENQGADNWGSTELLMEIARENTEGLDYDQLRSDIESRDKVPQVIQETEMGNKNGATSTPTVFVNGEMVRGNSYEDIKPVIERKLQENSE